MIELGETGGHVVRAGGLPGIERCRVIHDHLGVRELLEIRHELVDVAGHSDEHRHVILLGGGPDRLVGALRELVDLARGRSGTTRTHNELGLLRTAAICWSISGSRRSIDM